MQETCLSHYASVPHPGVEISTCKFNAGDKAVNYRLACHPEGLGRLFEFILFNSYYHKFKTSSIIGHKFGLALGF